MASPRLPFLWPMLYRATESAAPARHVVRQRALHSTSRRRQSETVPQRYGTANQPPPQVGPGTIIPLPGKSAAVPRGKALPKIGENLQKKGEHEIDNDKAGRTVIASSTEPKDAASSETKTQTPIGDPMFDSTGDTPVSAPAEKPKLPPEKPMTSILHDVPDPLTLEKEAQKASSPVETKSMPPEYPTTVSMDEHSPSVHPPHMDTPKYIHHFDTYGLVNRLKESGWTDKQAVTIMKSMRLLLADNLDVAKSALVSKSNVENETYLFRAACSELRTEIIARRKAEQEKMRTERTGLQHEVDILGQRLGQEIGTTRDEVRGMFDDRKMAVRNEQRSMEGKVQELNYKITVQLQSDSKSDVEGLRWVLTRRVIMTLGIMVVMVVTSLKLYSNEMHERELDEKRRANMRSSGSQTESNGTGSDFVADDRMGGGRRSVGTGGGEIFVKEGDNPAFVSLG
nr:hypothetical protein B0A51_16220 [Rachicladosporium sp. CCFEE 5018]